MKKYLALILALLMAFSIVLTTACGKKEEKAAPDANTELQEKQQQTEYKGPVTDYHGKTCAQLLEEGERPLVASTYPALADEYLVWLSTTLNGFFEEQGFSTMAMSAEGNIETQITQVENFITMGAVAIIEAAMDIEALAD